MDKIDQIKELVEVLNKWSYYYYTLDEPMVTDEEYDAVYDELTRLENESGIRLPDSPTQRIGDIIIEKFEKHKHINKLFSLDKSQTLEGLIDFDNRIKRELGKAEVDYIVELKFDGLTISLTYVDGALTVASTRGNGLVGENVTEQIKRIPSVPLTINAPGTLEVQGEAIMPLSALADYNNRNNVEKLKNARNAAAGAIRSLDTSAIRERGIDAYFYNVNYSSDVTFEYDLDIKKFLKDNRFKVSHEIYHCNSIKEVLKKVTEIDNMRVNLDFLIDGIVIKVNNIQDRLSLGYTNKFPKWAIAYKFEAEESYTKLIDVIWNVGRTSKVTPSAILEPVDIGGVTVSRATLNNYDYIKSKNIKINSDVLIRRSNDVIPEILRADTNLYEGIEIVKPVHCPSCGSELYDEGAHSFCPNTLSCKPQLVAKLTHFVSKDAMGIDGLSEKTIEKLFEVHNFTSISSFYELTEDDLIQLEGFKDKKIKNTLDAIETSKSVEFGNFIYALGIPNVGSKTASDLAKYYNDITKLINSNIDELLEIPDVGPKTAESIVRFFGNSITIKEIENLFVHGVEIIYNLETTKSENTFMDLTFVITGSFENVNRRDIEDKITEHGGKISSSVSRKTDYLVLGENPGSKYDKAVTLGTKIISLEEFNKMLGE